MKKNILTFAIIFFVCLIFYYMWDQNRVVKSDYAQTYDILNKCATDSDTIYYIQGMSADDDKKIITVYLSINSKENQDRIKNIKGVNKKYINFEQKPVDKTYKHLVIGGKSLIELDKSNIMSFKKGTIKNTGLTLVLNNKDYDFIYYGEEYSMEIMIDNEWYTIVVNQFFTDPLYSLKKDSIKEIKINWKYVYGKLEPGKYRIVKKFNTDLSESFNKYMACEFTIK